MRRSIPVSRAFDFYLSNNYIEDAFLTANFVGLALPMEIPSMKQVLTLPDQLSPLLQAARKTAKLSQTELAKRLDLSQSRMSAIELEPGSMRLDQLLAICSTLQLELVLQTKEVPIQNQPATSQLEW